MQSDLSPLVAVLGPTGAGKSELGLHLARTFGGEIINCDSIQVYRGFDIGSAKTPADQRQDLPHHLIDIIEAGEELTAGAYARVAREVLYSVRNRGRLPIVVGGTGFYFRALLEGLSPAPGRSERLRVRLRALAQRRPATLFRFLRLRDPAIAARIHPNDYQKLIRAIELIALASQPASATQSLPRDRLVGFFPLKLILSPDRALLRQRLNERSARMFDDGLLAETQALLESGVSPNTKPLQSLGYRQAVKVLLENTALADAIHECQTKTRQYAKRQITWFRAESDAHWLSGFGNESIIQAEAVKLCRAHVALFSPANPAPG